MPTSAPVGTGLHHIGGAHLVHLGIEAGHAPLHLALQDRRLQAPQPTEARAGDGVTPSWGNPDSVDRPATAALEQGGGDALLGPDEITATSGDEDDRAMGQRRRRQESGKRQCSGLGHCSRGQAHGL